METAQGTNGSTNGKHVEPDVWLQQYLDIVANESTSRSMLMRRMASTLDPRRNIDEECGYPATGSVSPQDYQELYNRDAIANRVVQVLAKETFKVKHSVYESEDEEEVTEFEQAVDDLPKQLGGGGSYYSGDQGSTINEYLMRADIASGIGRFGVILLGIDDGKPMSEPAEMRPEGDKSKGNPVRLLYMRVLPESLVNIQQYDSDPSSERFGQPVRYSITFNDPNNHTTGIGQPNATYDVHWSRVVHIAPDITEATSSEVFHTPRLQPVLNHILNLRKLYGAGAEGYWNSCFNILSFETNPQLGGQVDVDSASIRDQWEKIRNGLDRAVLTKGMTLKSIAPSVVDPKSQIDVQIQAICIKIPVPMRVFMGSERGELASSQDAGQWDDTVSARQQNVATPRLVVPLYDRLIAVYVLPVPGEGYKVFWPDITKQSDEQKAKVAGLVMTALAAYVAGGIEALVPPVNALTKILGWERDEVMQMLEDAAKEAEAKMEQDIALQEEMIDRGLAPDPTAPPEPVVEEPVEPEPAVANFWNLEDDWQPVKNVGDMLDVNRFTWNQFCPTGEGGGVDATCSTKSTGYVKDAAGNTVSSKTGLTTKEETALAGMTNIQPGRSFKLKEERELLAIGQARLSSLGQTHDRVTVPAADPKRDKRLRKTLGFTKEQWAGMSEEQKRGLGRDGEIPLIAKMYANAVPGSELLANVDDREVTFNAQIDAVREEHDLTDEEVEVLREQYLNDV